MGNSFGPRNIGSTGRQMTLTADGEPEFLSGGATIDWATVDAVAGSAATTPEGRTIEVGKKYLPMGTVMTRITASDKYGPADTAESDGRQTLSKGKLGLLDCSIVEDDPHSEHTGLIVGGTYYADRAQYGVTVAGAAQPTKDNTEDMLPRLVPLV